MFRFACGAGTSVHRIVTAFLKVFKECLVHLSCHNHMMRRPFMRRPYVHRRKRGVRAHAKGRKTRRRELAVAGLGAGLGAGAIAALAWWQKHRPTELAPASLPVHLPEGSLVQDANVSVQLAHPDGGVMDTTEKAPVLHTSTETIPLSPSTLITVPDGTQTRVNETSLPTVNASAVDVPHPVLSPPSPSLDASTVTTNSNDLISAYKLNPSGSKN